MTDPHNGELHEAIEKIRGALEATPRKSRRILLKTLLREFGFKVRSADRLTRITEGLNRAGILVAPDLATCDREAWVTLSLVDPSLPVHPVEELRPPVPDISQDAWFEDVQTKTFASEREVEIRFILPLLERLGYHEQDRADGFPVDIVVGVRKTRAEADFVLFDGDRREVGNVLLVVEAKRTGKRLTDHVAQARSYAMFLHSPYYLLTNGDDLRVFLYRSPIEADVEVYNSHRNALRENFADLYRLIGRAAVVDYRRAVAQGR
ncbi:type I restriction enzyme HsdR N-terminal domain-containing protein [Deinococcus sp. NW-56]|uniref:type I restriction enzyme HsdR N-terminal domain-containing protein n=1 Tax=Deinococcus sp. NW-56 TaxID=2080419 RepID=UPI000CF58122|nr:type I restriction enzyme HsdR N-terminal domain-containing protein [Deinococcus sp. NW-56]